MQPYDTALRAIRYGVAYILIFSYRTITFEAKYSSLPTLCQGFLKYTSTYITSENVLKAGIRLLYVTGLSYTL